MAGYHPSRRPVGTAYDRSQIGTKTARTSLEWIPGLRLPRRGAQGGVAPPATGYCYRRSGGGLQNAILAFQPPWYKFTVSPSSPYIPIAPWLRRASPGPWWSTEKAFWTRSSRLLAKAEALGSIHYKFRVDVDERSTGGLRLEAFSRPRTVSSSETSNRGGRG